MTDIFHEVEEDLRRDRLNKVWARYGSVFLTIAVLAVAATAGVVWWRQHQQNQAAAAAQTFADAGALVENGKLEESIAAFAAIAAPGGEGYPTMALFSQAGLLLAKNDVPGALALYDKVANSAADDKVKSLARLRAAYAVADTENPDVLKNRLADLIGDTSPWRFQARELQAFADFRKGDVKTAGEAYTALAADAAAPQSLRDRAGKMAVFIQGGAVLPPPPAATPVAPLEPAPPAATPAPETPPADAPQ
ncbi:hypothetical protein sos41_28580 [Alphaproteobacteria bacterium SO-S41]|nr:hypothetical protein sos41_28580 [Alphaproteobacteria bacterium SO-S41]